MKKGGVPRLQQFEEIANFTQKNRKNDNVMKNGFNFDNDKEKKKNVLTISSCGA